MKSRSKIFYLISALLLGGITNLYAQNELTADQMMSNLNHMTYKVDSLQNQVQMLEKDMKTWTNKFPHVSAEHEARYVKFLDEQVSYMLTGMRGSFNQLHALIQNKDAMSNRQVKLNVQQFQTNMLEITGRMEDVVRSMEKIQKSIQRNSLLSE